MPGDRRKSDSRRSSDRRATDRRAQNADRRAAESRRNAEAAAKASGRSKSAEPAQEAGGGFNLRGLMQRLARKLAILFVVLVLIFTGALVYFFSHFDYYMDRVAQKIRIVNSKATIDAESLTDRTTRASLTLKVLNQLPLAVVLQNLKLNVKISGYTVAKGVQVMPRVQVEAGQEKAMQVQFHVDSIMTRRGLQKAVQKNSGKILSSLLSRLQGKKEAFADDIKGLMTSEGSAEFRLLLGGIEIPFKRNFEFTQGS